MIDENMPVELRIESAVVLGSFAKGTEENIRGLIEAGCMSVLLKGKLGPWTYHLACCLF